MSNAPRTTLFFDCEGAWEKGFRAPVDFSAFTDTVLRILDNHGAKAVFNICGAVAEAYPKLVRTIHEDGHEAAVHGYWHENFLQLPADDQSAVLDRTEKAIEKITGARPIGARLPWLLHDRRLYELLVRRGYRWASNRRIYLAERFASPRERLDIGLPGGPALMRALATIRWRLFPKAPHPRWGLTEIPLLSSMDGELLGLVAPSQDSPHEWLDFAFRAMKKQFGKSGCIFNLNFHDWLIGSGNRHVLLDMILDHIAGNGGVFTLAGDLIDDS